LRLPIRSIALRKPGRPRSIISSQPFLAPLDEVAWQPAQRIPAYALRQPRGEEARQLQLFPAEDERKATAT
jgi:hypothetical protein